MRRSISVSLQLEHEPFFLTLFTGAHYCVGRPLALMVFRLLIAECATRFDVYFPAGKEDLQFLDGVEEAHTWRLSELPMSFDLRAK